MLLFFFFPLSTWSALMEVPRNPHKRMSYNWLSAYVCPCQSENAAAPPNVPPPHWKHRTSAEDVLQLAALDKDVSMAIKQSFPNLFSMRHMFGSTKLHQKKKLPRTLTASSDHPVAGNKTKSTCKELLPVLLLPFPNILQHPKYAPSKMAFSKQLVFVNYLFTIQLRHKV